jgi:hypothetical protein
VAAAQPRSDHLQRPSHAGCGRRAPAARPPPAGAGGSGFSQKTFFTYFLGRVSICPPPPGRCCCLRSTSTSHQARGRSIGPANLAALPAKAPGPLLLRMRDPAWKSLLISVSQLLVKSWPGVASERLSLSLASDETRVWLPIGL